MDGDSPHQISRLDHCLQTATRAENDGPDDETVVCALLHDIGDIISHANHSLAAQIFYESYVSERNYWIALHYGLFQGYYWMHHSDEDSRDALKNSPYYEACAEFYECGRSDIIRSKA